MRFSSSHQTGTKQQPPPAPSGQSPLDQKCHKLINADRVVVFLTGTPHEPQCRFTSMLVDLLDQIGLEYSYVDILEDDAVCEGLKKFSNWPTYPQMYVDGKLIGGYDIIKAMTLEGSFITMLNEKGLLGDVSEKAKQ